MGPAPGFRAYQYGTLYSIGDYGYSWASSITDSNAHYLYFTPTGLNPQDYYYRALGLPLRCLQE